MKGPVVEIRFGFVNGEVRFPASRILWVVLFTQLSSRYVDSRVNVDSPIGTPEIGMPNNEEYCGVNPTGTDFQPSCFIGTSDSDENVGILTLFHISSGPVLAAVGATNAELNCVAKPGNHAPNPFPE